MTFIGGLGLGLFLGALFVLVRESLAQTRRNRELGRTIRALVNSGNLDRLRKLAAIIEENE